MGDLEWTNDLVIRLMQEYQKRPELWDASHEMYRVQTLKYETWRELAHMFQCDIADLRKKLNSLFASHRREKGKVRSGAKSNWFLYPYMSFLPSHIDCDTLDSSSSAKARAPIKEVAPPSASEDEQEYSTEFLEEEEQPPHTEVLIKEEPALAPSGGRARRYRDKVHAKPRLTRPVRRRVLKEPAAPAHDARLAEALRLLRRADRRKDECDSFGEYIADSLRKHDDRTQSMIKQAINNILFEQEMKKYTTNQQYVVISGIDENPLILSDEPDK